jgi:hypothetical protein
MTAEREALLGMRAIVDEFFKVGGAGSLAEREIPSFITLYSAVVTKDNVDQNLPVGF